jgi:cytochrome c oxidase subunit 2
MHHLSDFSMILSQSWFDSLVMPTWLEELFFRSRAANEIGYKSDVVYTIIFWISTIFFVPMMGLMFYFVVKYRRRPGVPAPRSASHNTPLELAWSVVPTILLVWMFFAGFLLYMDHVVTPAGAENASLTAQKWQWRITYSNGGESPETTDELVAGAVPIFYVPANVPVSLRMTSQDVLHSLWVPAMRRKFDIYPNRYTTYWLQTDPLEETEGTEMLADGTIYKDYWVFCAEYCGDSHSEMAAIIRSVPPDYFQQWKRGIATPEDPWEWGQLLYKTRCASCHTLDGTTNIGPSWKGVWGRTEELEGGGSVVVDENYIRESIYEPAAKIVKGFKNQMNSFQGQLNDDELNAIITFMKSVESNPNAEGGQ